MFGFQLQYFYIAICAQIKTADKYPPTIAWGSPTHICRVLQLYLCNNLTYCFALYRYWSFVFSTDFILAPYAEIPHSYFYFPSLHTTTSLCEDLGQVQNSIRFNFLPLICIFLYNNGKTAAPSFYPMFSSAWYNHLQNPIRISAHYLSLN